MKSSGATFSPTMRYLSNGLNSIHPTMMCSFIHVVDGRHLMSPDGLFSISSQCSSPKLLEQLSPSSCVTVIGQATFWTIESGRLQEIGACRTSTSSSPERALIHWQSKLFRANQRF